MKIFFSLLLLPFCSIAQNTIGLPNIINYTKANYKGGQQNWKIRQAKNGLIYVANNEGLLSFDGKHWKIYALPNKTIVRSLEISNDGKIYVGGQDEIGFFAPNASGTLIYNSLLDKINKVDRAFSDIWEIVKYNNDIFFRTTKIILQLQQNSFTVYKAPSEWTYIGINADKLFAHDKKNGLLSFKNNVWENIPNSKITNIEITSILNSHSNNQIITTLTNGVFGLSNNILANLEEFNATIPATGRIFTAQEINNNWIAIGTTTSGVIIVDEQGKFVQRFSKIEGLQNNNIHCIFLDQQKNIWLGLDNGIDCIAFNSAVKLINPSTQGSSGYTAAVYDNKLYIGTSQGLLYTALETTNDLSFCKGVFAQVQNTNGQVWGLSEINEKLLLASHDGAFTIKGNTASKITNENGYWNFSPIESIFPTNKVISGNYNGLRFLNFSNNSFQQDISIPNFNETSRFVVVDKNKNIWVSHPYHGVYKTSLNTTGNYTSKLYTEKNGLPSTLNNHVYKIKGELAVATEKGVYYYNYTKDLFEPSEDYKKILGTQSIRYLKEDTEGNIWFVHEKKIGVTSFENNVEKIIYLPELNKKLLSGFEFIYPYNKNNIFIGGDEGLFNINFEKYKLGISKLQAQITSVNIINIKDSILFGGYFKDSTGKQFEKEIPEIKNNWKTIHFEFSTPYYGQDNSLEYSHRLKGFDNNWSEWSNISEKEYTNLPSKNYTFEIKVRNNNNIESEVTSYKFNILPPWYKSAFFYFIYFLLICTGFYYLYKRQQKKFSTQDLKNEEEQKKQQYLHQLEIEKTESELVTLRNEKLNTEIDFKNAELATTAMHLVQKGELLSKLKADLTQLTKGLDNDKAASEIKKMIKVLGEDDKMDNDWEHFAQHFDKVHSDFITILKENHPNITTNETKLSAYLHMNLSTKEIAQLMNISVRGIEISRYRLRKKLNLATEISLYEYLINLSKKKD